MIELTELQKDDVFQFDGSTDRMQVVEVNDNHITFINLTTAVEHVWHTRINFLEFKLIMRNGRVLS